MDKDLIYAAQHGDENAASVVVEEFKGTVKAIARGYFLIGGDLDDLVQEGMIGLFKAINSYEPEKSDEFKPFALICINREIINCIKKNNTAKNQILSKTVSLSSLSENALKVSSPENIILSREENVRLLNIIDENLSSLEKKVVLMFIKGFNYSEIAEKVSVEAKTVDNALQRVRNKLSKILQR